MESVILSLNQFRTTFMNFDDIYVQLWWQMILELSLPSSLSVCIIAGYVRYFQRFVSLVCSTTSQNGADFI